MGDRIIAEHTLLPGQRLLLFLSASGFFAGTVGMPWVWPLLGAAALLGALWWNASSSGTVLDETAEMTPEVTR